VRQSVITRCDAPEVLQPVEGVLDQPSRLVKALVKAERLFSAAPVGNDGLRSTLLQLLAQLGAIVSLIAEHVFRWFHFADEVPGDWAVMRFAARQQDGKQASFSIRACMDLRVTPSS
jgi:hypothetical protein